jgi:hypothetical protein
VRWRELRHRNLQLLEGCKTNEVESRTTVYQDVVELDVGDSRGDEQR